MQLACLVPNALLFNLLYNNLATYMFKFIEQGHPAVQNSNLHNGLHVRLISKAQCKHDDAIMEFLKIFES
jgi:hypothetical protein